jgi:methionyl-tRNA synthetase
MDCSKLRLGLQIVMLVSARGNLYLQRCGLSNTLFENDPQTCATVISRAINLIWVLSVLAHPFMPSTSDAILDQLNAPARTVPEKFSNDILAGHHLGKPEHLFKKIDEKMEGVWRAKFGGTQEEQAAKAAAEAAPLSKKKAAAAKKAAVATKGLSDLPKSTEEVALEKQIEEQAARVRVLKLDGTKGSELDVAVAELLSRKQALETVRKHGIDLTPLA